MLGRIRGTRSGATSTAPVRTQAARVPEPVRGTRSRRSAPRDEGLAWSEPRSRGERSDLDALRPAPVRSAAQPGCRSPDPRNEEPPTKRPEGRGACLVGTKKSRGAERPRRSTTGTRAERSAARVPEPGSEERGAADQAPRGTRGLLGRNQEVAGSGATSTLYDRHPCGAQRSPGAGEGTRTLTPCGHRNLNPACLPFHHSGRRTEPKRAASRRRTRRPGCPPWPRAPRARSRTRPAGRSPAAARHPPAPRPRW